MSRPNKYKLYLERDSNTSVPSSTKYDARKRNDKQGRLLEPSLNLFDYHLLPQESFERNQNNNLLEPPLDLSNNHFIQQESLEINRNSNLSRNNSETGHERNDTPLPPSINNTNNANNNSDDNFFIELRKIMDSESFSAIIKECVNISRGDIYVMLLKYALTNFLSQTATENLFKMINCFYDRPIIPDTRYLINKLFNPSSTIEYHIQCSFCKQIIQFKSSTAKTICEFCGTEINIKSDFFITLNIAHELANCLEKYEDYYDDVVNERKHKKNIYSDIYDGTVYRKFLGTLPAVHRHSYATLIFNADGAPVFKSSNASIWPIQIMINELPIQVRTRHLLLGALWFGKSKPDMSIFLTPFVNKMNKLSTSGVECNIRGEKKNIKVYALNCCVDSQARAPMQGINQFNGYYGCNWCLHPGEWVKRHVNGRGSVKYPNIPFQAPELRDKQNTISMMDKLDREAAYDDESDHESSPELYGIKSRTPLCDLESFDIINGFVPDYLHCCLLGIGKQFLNYWCNTTDKLFSFSADDERIINENMKYIKVPHQVSRLTRTLKDQSHWKAREYENWILYYSLPLLSLTSLPNNYISHWALFVEALHLLLKSNISLDEIRTANNFLHRFVQNTEELYTKNAMTFNIHQLTHLAKSVREWGPLWAHSSFAFESGNFYLLKMIKAAKGVNHQICRNLFMAKAIEFILSQKREILSHKINKFCHNLENKIVQKTLVLSQIRYFGETSSIKLINIALKIGLKPINLSFYTKMIKNQCVYSTFKKVNQRSDNSLAILGDNSFIHIESFIVDHETNQELTLCRKVIVNNLSVSRVEVIKIDKICQVIDTNTIKSICVFINLLEKQYLCKLPNLLSY